MLVNRATEQPFSTCPTKFKSLLKKKLGTCSKAILQIMLPTQFPMLLFFSLFLAHHHPHESQKETVVPACTRVGHHSSNAKAYSLIQQKFLVQKTHYGLIDTFTHPKSPPFTTAATSSSALRTSLLHVPGAVAELSHPAAQHKATGNNFIRVQLGLDRLVFLHAGE